MRMGEAKRRKKLDPGFGVNQGETETIWFAVKSNGRLAPLDTYVLMKVYRKGTDGSTKQFVIDSNGEFWLTDIARWSTAIDGPVAVV